MADNGDIITEFEAQLIIGASPAGLNAFSTAHKIKWVKFSQSRVTRRSIFLRAAEQALDEKLRSVHEAAA